MARKYQLHGAFPSKAGDSAYEVALKNGFVGTEQEWLDSLVGPPGKHGTGDSAYEVALKNGFEGTEQEWLDSLVGPPGTGDSAYEVALKNGFEGTEQEWLDSLVGPEGPTGATFYSTVILEEDVSSVNLLLPVNWESMIQFNIHADTKGTSLTSDMSWQTEVGGSYKKHDVLKADLKGLNVYGIRFYCEDSRIVFAIGTNTAYNAHDTATPTIGNLRCAPIKDRNNFMFMSLTDGVMFPKGMRFDVWGVYA